MINKINIMLLLVTFAALSCKKEHSQSGNGTPDNKLHTVTLTINPSGFSQTINSDNKLSVNSITTNPTDFKKYFDTLYINFNGKVYTYSTKNLTTINVTQQLFAGTYTVAAIAGKKGLNVSAGTSITGSLQIGAYYIDPTGHKQVGQWLDSFCGIQTFTVTDADVTVNLNLNRVDAEVEVVVQDTIPKNVNYIQFTPSMEYYYYDVDINNSYQLDKTVLAAAARPAVYFTVPDSSKGKPNFIMDYISLNTVAPFSITMTAYGNSLAGGTDGGILATKVINNISLVTNQKSIYTGTLFGGIVPNGVGGNFKTTIDTSWNATPILKSF